MTVFVDARAREDKARALASPSSELYVVRPCDLAAIPRSPFAYWLPERVRGVFTRFRCLPEYRDNPLIGASTGNDMRYLRLRFEVWPREMGERWRGFTKGGPFARFYSDQPTVVAWSEDRQTFFGFVGRPGRMIERPNGLDDYFRPAITWSQRSQLGLSLRALPSGFVFGHKGPVVLAAGNQPQRLGALLALSNSTVFTILAEAQMAFGAYEVGVLQRAPVPDLDSVSSEVLASLALRGWSLRRSLDTCVEVSHAFVVPAVLQVGGGSFGECVVGWAERVVGVEAELVVVQAEIDEVCFELYGISEEDRKAITEGFGVSGDSEDQSDRADVDLDEEPGVGLDPVGLAGGLVSWCVGVAAGRFDVRLATGARAWPLEPDPFDPLPVCSPAMLTGGDGLPLVEAPVGYPLDPSPVLVVDPGHRLDVTGRVRDVFDVVFGADADAWWTEVGEVLDPRGGEVGTWLSKGFFEHHLKTHSKSRRKAPIVWPIGTRSGSYQVWLYAHRVTGDSLFRVLNDLIVPKLNAEESKLTRLRQESGPNPSASERKTIDTQEKFVSELVELREMVEELAPLWAPDLNDGVVIVLAPLWRLFAFHKPWMRELKKHWEKLVKGEYDWAQLAMYLWPERVIPKCADDRSLAIAHGLEDVFWEPDLDHDGKWIQSDTPTTPIDQLTTDRHNPTTQAALNTMERT